MLLVLLFLCVCAFHDQGQPVDTGITLPGTMAARPSVMDITDVTAYGQSIGYEFEAYLSPWQERDEESTTPSYVPVTFRSTKPSVIRNKRPERAVASVQFTRDLSKARGCSYTMQDTQSIQSDTPPLTAHIGLLLHQARQRHPARHYPLSFALWPARCPWPCPCRLWNVCQKLQHHRE